MTTIKDHCGHMTRYGAWAYERLFASLAMVSDADYRADSGLFFRSLHGTLNHLLLADSVWFGRFTGQPFAAGSLAQELEPDRAALIARLRAQGERARACCRCRTSSRPLTRAGRTVDRIRRVGRPGPVRRATGLPQHGRRCL